jgi:hypothetical protein
VLAPPGVPLPAGSPPLLRPESLFSVVEVDAGSVVGGVVSVLSLAVSLVTSRLNCRRASPLDDVGLRAWASRASRAWRAPVTSTSSVAGGEANRTASAAVLAASRRIVLAVATSLPRLRCAIAIRRPFVSPTTENRALCFGMQPFVIRDATRRPDILPHVCRRTLRTRISTPAAKD